MRLTTFHRTAAVFGLAGPAFYALLVAALGAMYPGYSHISQTMSVLGAVDAPQRLIMDTLGFPLLGLCVVLFSYALDHGVKRTGVIWWIGPALIVISGIALAMTGVFAGDPGNVDISWRGTTHSTFAVIAAVSFAIAPFFIGVRQWSDARWRNHAAASQVVAAVTLALSWVSSLDAIDAYAGLFQRIGMGIPMLWMMVTSARILRVSAPRPATGPIRAK